MTRLLNLKAVTSLVQECAKWWAEWMVISMVLGNRRRIWVPPSLGFKETGGRNDNKCSCIKAWWVKWLLKLQMRCWHKRLVWKSFSLPLLSWGMAVNWFNWTRNSYKSKNWSLWGLTPDPSAVLRVFGPAVDRNECFAAISLGLGKMQSLG